MFVQSELFNLVTGILYTLCQSFCMVSVTYGYSMTSFYDIFCMKKKNRNALKCYKIFHQILLLYRTLRLLRSDTLIQGNY